MAALLTGGYWAYRFLNPGEETRIRNRLADLAETVSLKAGAGNIRKGLMLEQFPRFFSRDCQITVTVQSVGKRTLSGRPEMAEAAKYVMGLKGGMEAKFHDLAVTVGEAENRATAALTLTMMMTDTESLSAQELQLELVKVDGTWLISRATSIESLMR
jgi:hypothetical protein